MPDYKEVPNPPWLVHMMDQRVAELSAHVDIDELTMGLPAMIMTTLTEPPANATEAQFNTWNMTCDRCGQHQADGVHPGRCYSQIQGRLIELTFGVCDSCADGFGKGDN